MITRQAPQAGLTKERATSGEQRQTRTGPKQLDAGLLARYDAEGCRTTDGRVEDSCRTSAARFPQPVFMRMWDAFGLDRRSTPRRIVGLNLAKGGGL